MTMKVSISVGLMLGASCFALAAAQEAQRGDSDKAGEDAVAVFDKVTVTARRRAERLQDVPVVVYAFNKEQLEAFGAGDVEDVAEFTPGLIVDGAGGAGWGSAVLRGISTGELNYSNDQAVSINIDGVQLSNAMGFRYGQYDMEQVEVLKGPQALFFGKNSPAGIIAVKSSDPTDETFVQFRAGYEENAEEVFGEGVVSGPISQTLGGRLVLRASDQKGAYNNLAPGVTYSSKEDYRELFGRLTLVWKPSETLDAKFKLAMADTEGSDQGVQTRFGCDTSGLPGPISGPVETCEVDGNFVQGDPDPRLATLSPFFRSEPSGATDMTLASLEINYDLSDSLTLSSLTGYSDLGIFDYYTLLPILLEGFVSGREQEEEQLSQEFRLTSDYDSKLNFMLGVFLDTRDLTVGRAMRLPAPPVLPAGSGILFENTHFISADSQSVFGELSWDLTDTIELTGGARYTEETKKLSGVGALTGNGAAIIPPGDFTNPNVPTGPFMPSPDDVSYTNLSPEITLAWRPSRDLTVFGSYREGFKSGGFNSSVTGSATLATVPSDQSFDEETGQGFEIGFKSTPKPNLRINGAAFSFDYEDIQLTTFDLTGGGIATRVVNAAEATTEGFELDAAWQPNSIDGLSLTGSVAYTDARFTSDLYFQCNGVQLAGDMPGCDFLLTPTAANPYVPVAAGTGDIQNLRGRPLLRAPEWAGTLGFAYDAALTDGLRWKLHGSTNYQGSYEANIRYDPRATQDAYWTVNAGIGLYSANDRWAIDLIGRNLTDEIAIIGAGGVLPAGGTVAGVSSGELQGPQSRPRSILLQLTYRPFGGQN
ncbi:MAG: TonB-dependent receptor [Parvibaculaceae bacterium]